MLPVVKAEYVTPVRIVSIARIAHRMAVRVVCAGSLLCISKYIGLLQKILAENPRKVANVFDMKKRLCSF
ncbi:hypothetical protein SAMN05518672_103780 [Chitinophaga sp. CF118]|nr:hypothetical protein SAMN05518672_103780 [Chitinophaga sp. CF118]